jgi:hypothetical protein
MLSVPYPRLAFSASLTDNLQWSDGRIIALLTVGGICLIGFVVVQILFPDTATIPNHLVKNRTVVAAFIVFVFFSCSNFVFSKSIRVLYIVMVKGSGTHKKYSLLHSELVSSHHSRLGC